METYNTFGFTINITDSTLLNEDLKNRLRTNVWEENEVRAAKYISENACVLELGGCLGIASLAINKRLANPKAHIVLEPNPKLIPHMERIRDDNGCQYEIVQSFISTVNETMPFSLHPNHIMGGQLGSRPGYEEVVCESTTTKDLEEKYNLTFDTIIMDIEHGEYILHKQGFFDKKNLSNIKFLMIELHQGPNKNPLIQHLKSLFQKEIILSHSNQNSVIIFYNEN